MGLLLICAVSWTGSPSDDPASTSGDDAAGAAAPAFELPADLDLAGLTAAEIEQTVTGALAQVRDAWVAAHNTAVREAVAAAVKDTAAATIREYQPRVDGAEAALAEAQAQLRQCHGASILGRIQAAILGVGAGWIAGDLLTPAPAGRP